MARYREKPAEIEACQFANSIEMTDWLREAVNKGIVMFMLNDDGAMYAQVETKEYGKIIANFGDYFIHDPKHDIWVLSKDFFETRYEKLED